MPKFKPLPPVEVLRAELEYLPKEGILLRRYKNDLFLTGYVATDGYLVVGLGGPGQLWQAHRLIWKLVTGKDPGEHEIDHINRDRIDNRWNNLRLVDRYEQMANRGKLCTNSSGLKGVYTTSKGTKPYKSSIMRNGRVTFLGYFSTAEEAHNAYINAGGLP
jgi:hypothetical protein